METIQWSDIGPTREAAAGDAARRYDRVRQESSKTTDAYWSALDSRKKSWLLKPFIPDSGILCILFISPIKYPNNKQCVYSQPFIQVQLRSTGFDIAV